MSNQQHEHVATLPVQEKSEWQAPKLTKHGDIASLTKQLLGPDGIFPKDPSGPG